MSEVVVAMSEWIDRNRGLAALTVLSIVSGLVVVLCEVVTHAKEILRDGMKPCMIAFWEGMSGFWFLLATSIGATAASTTLLSCVVIPVTTVAIYVLFRKAEERPKAVIVAVGLFLNPLFIDFFRDKINEKYTIEKLWVGAFGAVTFLGAMFFWESASELNRHHGASWKKTLAQLTAIVLFLFPTLCMLGYVAAQAHERSQLFAENFTTANIIGLIGLLLTAFVGISMSRFYEAP
jgi:hypothetical protein